MNQTVWANQSVWVVVGSRITGCYHLYPLFVMGENLVCVCVSLSLSLSLSGQKKGSHSPAIIRIGSDGKPAFSSPSKKKSPQPPQLAKETPATHTLQTSPSHRLSSTASGSSSPDSLSSGGGGPGGKFSFEGTRGSPRGSQASGQSSGESGPSLKHTSSDSTVGVGTTGKNKDLSEVNK